MSSHTDNSDERSPALRSLKTRMAGATDPSERVVSASPTGDWLDGLRTSFEPGGKKKPEPETTPGLVAGQLRSA